MGVFQLLYFSIQDDIYKQLHLRTYHVPSDEFQKN